jgi:hypothetical protein
VDRKRIEELKKATKLAVAAASRQQRMGTQPFGPARAATVAVPATVIGASPLEADEANETDLLARKQTRASALALVLTRAVTMHP